MIGFVIALATTVVMGTPALAASMQMTPIRITPVMTAPAIFTILSGYPQTVHKHCKVVEGFTLRQRTIALQCCGGVTYLQTVHKHCKVVEGFTLRQRTIALQCCGGVTYLQTVHRLCNVWRGNLPSDSAQALQGCGGLPSDIAEALQGLFFSIQL